MAMKLAFTGSQRDMTHSQFQAVRHLFWLVGSGELHHGDCIGADAEAHELGREVGFRMVGHPCTLEAKRAHCEFDEVREPDEPLTRNDLMLDECEALIAAPSQFREVQRDGAWYTVRSARRRKMPVVIVYPDGNTAWERPDEFMSRITNGREER